MAKRRIKTVFLTGFFLVASGFGAFGHNAETVTHGVSEHHHYHCHHANQTCHSHSHDVSHH